MHLIPHELYVGEIFFPPMLLDAHWVSSPPPSRRGF